MPRGVENEEPKSICLLFASYYKYPPGNRVISYRLNSTILGPKPSIRFRETPPVPIFQILTRHNHLKMKSYITVFFAVVAMVAFGVSQLAAHTWILPGGYTVEGELVHVDDTSIVVRRADGKKFGFKLADLSAADLAFVDAATKSGAVVKMVAPDWVAVLNRALGMPMFYDGLLWDDPQHLLAGRLMSSIPLRPETVTPLAGSFRAYLQPPLMIMGAPAYMLSMRSENGKVSGVTIMFSNRGDAPVFAERVSSTPISNAEVEAFQSELKRDFDRLRANLTAALPKGESEPTATQRRAYPGELAIFNVADHELVLQALPAQMLILRVQPAERIAPPRLSDDQARQRMKDRVTWRDNGDIVIDRIPMVDQGPKGYCVPATFERVLRYAGIPADMYELAVLGRTNFGGGTNVTHMVESLGPTVRQAGRTLEKVQLKAPTAAAIARFIDEGRPLFWGMASTRDFNEVADYYSKARRRAAANFKAWASERRIPSTGLIRDPSAAHLCLIIGYNRTTNEIAFSDSWGPQYVERWLPATVLEQASLGQFWVLGL